MTNKTKKVTPAAVLKERKRRAKEIVKILQEIDPHPKIALEYGNPWELVVAVQLSAQCTDKKVNEVTPSLFRKYKTIKDYAGADPVEFKKDIRQITFHNNKTRNIIGAARMVLEKWDGKLPETMEEMTSLPGMGRKSSNIILGLIHGIYVGIPVDTHVRRISRQLGLTNHIDPDKIEQDLLEAVPEAYWPFFNFLLVDYGRTYCPARPHDHIKKGCPLAKYQREEVPGMR